jgi:hypothetical protein
VNRFAILCAAGLLAGGVFVSGQVSQIPEPRRGFGASVTPAFEGWFYNPDGSRSFLVGYYNRNGKQELDIPIGANNKIEPGGPDMGQPTHFMPGRQWGIFVIPAPKDYKESDNFTWTLTANGVTNAIPFRLHPDYVMSPFSEIAVGNTPPTIGFDPGGKTVQGPLTLLSAAPTRTAAANTPMPLDVFAMDDLKYTSGTNAPVSGARQPVTLTVNKYRGPGAVTIDKAKPAVEKIDGKAPFNGKARTTVTFSEPGEYALQVIANDYSGDGGGGFGCCWTTTVVKVTVK